MAENRLARELESRSTQERPKQWQRPETLPQPDKQPGYDYRWVRVSSLGQADARNISSKTREGWEPVRIEEQPRLQLLTDPNSRFKDNVEIAGLLLCKIPSEFMDQRRDYYSKMNKRSGGFCRQQLYERERPTDASFFGKKVLNVVWQR
jgi:hypothetical protein